MSAREVAQSQQKGPSTKERLTTIVDGFDNFDNEMKTGTIIIIGIDIGINNTITITIPSPLSSSSSLLSSSSSSFIIIRHTYKNGERSDKDTGTEDRDD